MSPTLLLLRVVVLAVLFCAFLYLERRGRGVAVVLIVLGSVLLDATFYSGTGSSALPSIFHPTLFGQTFRLPQLIIPLALLARYIVRGMPRRLDASAVFWAAFFAWVLVSAVVGLIAGHARQLVLGEGAIVVQVGGMILLAATVPADSYVRDPLVPRFFQAAAAVATALFLVDVSGFRWSGDVVPDLPLENFGGLGADAATLFSSLGVVALVLGVSRPRHLGSRAVLLVPAVLLILSHLASTQRAARLGLYVTLLLLLAFAITPTARRRLRLSLRQVGFGAALLGIVGLGGVFVPAVLDAAAPDHAVSTADAGQFAPRNRQGSIESRFNQWTVVADEIQGNPLTGEGLGGTFVSYDEGKNTFVSGNISHNIVLDLLRRTGAVGVILGACALLAVWAQNLVTWRYHRDNRVAALAAAMIAVTAGLLAKGMVESIFEKHRLAVLLGALIGIAISCNLSPGSARPASVSRRRELEGSVTRALPTR